MKIYSTRTKRYSKYIPEEWQYAGSARVHECSLLVGQGAQHVWHKTIHGGEEPLHGAPRDITSRFDFVREQLGNVWSEI